MIDLLSKYDTTQVIIFIALVVIAIKSVWDMIDYFKNKYKEKFNKDYEQIESQKAIEKYYLEGKDQHQETLKVYERLENQLNKIENSVEKLSNKVNKLTESDMHDIKQFIVREHHYFVSKGWIDDYSLDSIMLRYEDYKEEGGNSYIKTLVEEIKALPKQQPPTV